MSRFRSFIFDKNISKVVIPFSPSPRPAPRHYILLSGTQF